MSAAAPARLLASPAIRTLVSRRLAELGGLALGLGGVALLVALACYNPLDPSLNTATSRPPTNLAGPAGAMAADLLLQSFGVAAVLPGMAALAWAWRIASHRGLGSFATRLASTLGALPVLAALAAAYPGTAPWPAEAGPGGAIGRVLAESVAGYAQGVLGPLGAAIALLLGTALGLLLFWAALGLSAGEWRAAGRVAGGSIAQGRRAVGWLPRLMAPLRLLRRAPPATPAIVPRGEPALRPRPTPPLPTPEAAKPPEAEPAPRPRISLPLRKAAPAHQPSLPLPDAMAGQWRMPPLALLKAAPPRANTGPSEESLQNNARLLESVLDEYGVQGTIREIRPGPVVTLYELEPAPGIRSARVIGLADDVARSLSVTAVRIATVPGRNVIGIEVPNAKRETVFLVRADRIAKPGTRHQGRLRFGFGQGHQRRPDRHRPRPHAPSAHRRHHRVGQVGRHQRHDPVAALQTISPDQCRLIMIDPKMLELSVYEGIPHLMAPCRHRTRQGRHRAQMDGA